MALDGVILRHIKNEIESTSLDFRIDKIYEPNKEEIIIFLRGKNQSKKLLISSRANSPRINFIEYSIENPNEPPMFCMLLRKKLLSSRLIRIRQQELERVLFLDFAAKNELGDPEKLTLAVEIMGKYSNIILIDENGVIIDAIKRINSELSSKRIVLPGVKYELPPSQNKLCIIDYPAKEIVQHIELISEKQPLNKIMLNLLQGISPVVCREIEYLMGGGQDGLTHQMSSVERTKLVKVLSKFKNCIVELEGSPYMILDSSNIPIDITFFYPTQYQKSVGIKRFETFSSMIDKFYFEKDSKERMKSKSQDLVKKIIIIHERLMRKTLLQQQELESCYDREKYRIWADIINANLYNIEKGCKYVELKNFYDENESLLRIQMDPILSAAKNAQKYYKKYRKLKTAQYVLRDEIKKAIEETKYIEAVLDELSRASSENELIEIKEELYNQGYIKRLGKDKKKNRPSIGPIEEVSTEGLKILIGRNNKQNDKLTLKIADKQDVWLHVKDMPGSHVIIKNKGREINDLTLKEAATLAAKHSKACNSSQVPVDYTKVRNVSKPNGAKPGMVIYVKYKTIYVNP